MDLKILTENKWWTVLAAIVAIASSVVAVDARYAKDVELAMVRDDFASYKVEQSIDDIQKRIYDTKDRLMLQDNTKREREDLTNRLHELEMMKEKQERQLKDIKEKAK